MGQSVSYGAPSLKFVSGKFQWRDCAVMQMRHILGTSDIKKGETTNQESGMNYCLSYTEQDKENCIHKLRYE